MKKYIILLFVFLNACSSNNPDKIDGVEKEKAIVSGQGGDIGNGGDPCENRILSIRDDIRGWINKGGADKLRLPKEITLKEYKSKMLQRIKTSTMSCTTKRLFYKGVEKTCLNSGQEKGSFVCNFERFSSGSEEEQYILTHHEYAGLSGLEVNDNKIESDYFISNQISSFLEITFVKRLSINSQNSYMRRIEVPNLRSSDDRPMRWENIRADYSYELFHKIFSGKTIEPVVSKYTKYEFDFKGDWHFVEKAYKKLKREYQVPVARVKDNIFMSLIKNDGESGSFILFNQEVSAHRKSVGDFMDQYNWYVTFPFSPKESFEKTKLSSFFTSISISDNATQNFDEDIETHCLFGWHGFESKKNICSIISYDDD